MRFYRWMPVCLAFFLLSGLPVSHGLYSQETGLKPVTRQLYEASNGIRPRSFDIFKVVEAPDLESGLADELRMAEYLVIDVMALSDLLALKEPLINLGIPGSEGTVLELFYKDIFTSGYQIRTSENLVAEHSDMATYRGIIRGNPNSVAVVSVFSDEIRVVYSDSRNTVRIQKMRDGRYIKYRQRDRLTADYYECYTDDTASGATEEPKGGNNGTRSTGNCVEIYFECDHESYLDNNSSVAETEEWVAAIFNEVSTIYDNEEIPIGISEIKVWTTTDPYASLNSTSALLNEFVDQIAANGYNGRLAHLLSTRSLGGGIAYLDVLCSTTVPCAVSTSLSTNIQPFPNYSWTIEVVAHEMGHNFGSSHTHSCVWNGNNTQIDDCGNQYLDNNNGNPGSCYDPDNPILPESGTIMSYCHLIAGVGIDFNNGFGLQPGDLIRDRYINATCNTGECGAPACTMLSDPVNGQTNVDSESLVSWESTGANGYKITVGTSPGSGNIENNLDVGNNTTYDPGGLPFDATVYVKVIPYNTIGDALDCSEESFTTEPNIQPLCTQLATPADGATDVDIQAILTWDPALGNQLGYKLNAGYTPGGGELIDELNVGNVTSYDPGGLPADTTIYVRVTPFGTLGDAEGCPITSFTTEPGLVEDFCTGAIEISCGSTVSNSTLEATDDDVSNCGTAISAPGVWFTFTGDGSNVVLSTCGAADYDSKISVYHGSCDLLVCVTGNDDWSGCGVTSQVSFSTTPGWQYFVLVHGWNGDVGNFSMTMACSEPPYCPSQGIVIDHEWISEFSLDNFVKPSGAAHYSDFTQDTIAVQRGETYDISIVPGFASQSYNEYFRVWADFNQDGDFSDPGEQLFEQGPEQEEASGTITIPLEALSGGCRMRVAMKHNSFPTSCQVFTYGEVEEYTLRIKCDIVTSTSETGPGSITEILECAGPGDTISFSTVVNGGIINLNNSALNLVNDVVLYAETSQNITIRGQSTAKVFVIPIGAQVELHGLGITGGTSTSGNCVDNAGNLILKNITLHQHTGDAGATLLENRGQLHLAGNCDIHDP